MTVKKTTLKERMLRVSQLKQAMIEKAKKIPGVEAHVQKRMQEYHTAQKESMSR